MQLLVDDVKLTSSIHVGDIKQLLHEQQADQSIQQVVRYLEAGYHPAHAERKSDLPNTVKLMHEWHKLFIDKRGLLCRRSEVNVIQSKLFYQFPSNHCTSWVILALKESWHLFVILSTSNI